MWMTALQSLVLSFAIVTAASQHQDQTQPLPLHDLTLSDTVMAPAPQKPSIQQAGTGIETQLADFLNDPRTADEVSSLVASMQPGSALMVKGEFVRQDAPWRLGEAAAACPRN